MREWLDELEQYAIEVILDRKHGFRPSLLRVLLWLLSSIYRLIVQLRIYLYRSRILKEHQLGCLVISIAKLPSETNISCPAARCGSRRRISAAQTTFSSPNATASRMPRSSVGSGNIIGRPKSSNVPISRSIFGMFIGTRSFRSII